MLNIGTEYRNGIFFVRLKGKLNKNTVYKLNKKVTNIIKNNGINRIVFNFTNLKEIDMKGISTLFYNYEICKNNSGISFICGSNESIKNKLKKTRIINYIYEIPNELIATKLINSR